MQSKKKENQTERTCYNCPNSFECSRKHASFCFLRTLPISYSDYTTKSGEPIAIPEDYDIWQQRLSDFAQERPHTLAGYFFAIK